MIYAEYKCYGPYYRKDGRQHIILIRHNQSGEIIERKTVSYPKYLVENYLNRPLTENETVDHIDGNFLNNDLSNLRIVLRNEHSKSHAVKRVLIERICPICGKKYLSYNNKTCGSKSCRGKCAHINGYNKGNSFPDILPQKQSSRSTI